MKKIISNIILVVWPLIVFCQLTEFPVDYYKALGYQQNDKSDSALLILSTHKENSDCALLIADILWEQGDFNTAISDLKNLYNVEPAASSLLLARIYASLGFSDEAVYWLEKYFENREVLSYSEIISFTEFDQINRSTDWRKFWETSRYPKNTEKLIEAEYLINSGDNTQALSILDSQNFGAREYIKKNLIAKINYSEGSFNAALNYVNLALYDKPEYEKSLELKYLISFEIGNYSDAYNSALDLIKLYPENPKNLIRYSEACLATGKNSEALIFANIYCESFPNNEEAIYLKTRILINDLDYRNALIVLNKLVELNPSQKEYFILRGTAYYNLESWQFARNDFAMALDIDPNIPDVMYMAGVCWHELGFDNKACRWWQKAAGQKHRKAAEMLFKYCE